MNHDPDRLVTRIELRLRWADVHGVRYDDAGKSFDEVARDYYQTSDAYRELLTPGLRGDGPSATHQAAANTAYARALLIEAVIERRGGDLDLSSTLSRSATRTDGSCRSNTVPRCWGEWEDVAPVPAAAPEESPLPHDAPTMDAGFRP